MLNNEIGNAFFIGFYSFEFSQIIKNSSSGFPSCCFAVFLQSEKIKDFFFGHISDGGFVSLAVVDHNQCRDTRNVKD